MNHQHWLKRNTTGQMQDVILSYVFVLQGRALLNAIGNLELTGSYAEALTKLGHKLEDVAIEVSLCF